MKYAHASLASALFLAAAAAPARTAVLQDPEDVFRTQFQKALDAGQKPELQKLVKNDPVHAGFWIVRSAEAVVADPASKEKALFDGLAEAWKTAWKCEFPEREMKYLAGLDAAKRKTRTELLARWKPVWREFEGNLEKKD